MVPPDARPRAAITAVFAVNGALFTSLYSRLPALQAEPALSEGQLGLALLAAPIGLIAAQVAAWPSWAVCAWRSGWSSACAWSPPCSRRSR